MVGYESKFSSSRPVVFVDSADYIQEDFSFFNRAVMNSLDFDIIARKLMRVMERFNVNGEIVLRDYCIPTQDIDEIRARQDVVSEIYENEGIEATVADIIKSSKKIHVWSDRFIEGKSFKEKTEEVEHLVELVESSLSMKSKSSRLKSVKSFARKISRTKEYKVLKAYTSEVSLDFFKDHISDCSEFQQKFARRDKKFTAANLVESYQQIASNVRSYSKQISRLNIDVRRKMFNSLINLQSIFKQFMSADSLESLIDRNEVEKLGLEEELDFAITQLRNTAILNFKHRSKVTSSQRYFLEGFGSLLDHIDQLFSEGLDRIISSLGINTKDMTKELMFYYSLANLAHKMAEKSKITMPIIRPPEERYCSVSKGNIPSFTLRRGKLVSNDIYSNDKEYIFLLTGANDNGKTTYERMVGQIQILAQLGSFVPAKKAEISVVDCIMTSFGGADKPNKKEGSFRSALNFLNFITSPRIMYREYNDWGKLDYEEIAEPSSIEELKEAYQNGRYVFFTPHSLLLFDEIAIGSDNQATEEAISRALRSAQARNTRLYISTHYHPIASQVQNGDFPNTINLGAVMRVTPTGKLKETYKIIRGSHEESHGQRLFKEAKYTENDVKETNKFLEEAGLITPKQHQENEWRRKYKGHKP